MTASARTAAQAARDPAARRLLVGDVMSRDPVLLRTDMRLEPAVELLVDHGFSGAPVIDRHGCLVGMLHALDAAIMHLPMEHPAPRRTRHILVGEICRDAVTISPARVMHAAAARMRAHDTDRLVVVDEADQVIGVVTGHDLLRTIARRGDLLREIVDEQIAAMAVPQVRADVDYAGVVLLTGAVDSSATRERLVRAVGALDGVTEVDELLTIAEDP